jgi:hypothetical protein
MEEPKYSASEIERMKMAGMTRPTDCSVAEWTGIGKLKPSHELIAYMLAQGMSVGEICKKTKRSRSFVNTLQSRSRFTFRVQELQYLMYGRHAMKKLQSLVPHAINATAEVLQDDEAKASSKLRAAELVLDRVMGKPKQTIEYESASLSDFYKRLDQIIEAKKVPPKEIEGTEEIVIEAEVVDEVDEWCEANL